MEKLSLTLALRVPRTRSETILRSSAFTVRARNASHRQFLPVLPWGLVLVIVLLQLQLQASSVSAAKWAVQVRGSDTDEHDEIARNVASELNLRFHSRVGALTDTFLYLDDEEVDERNANIDRSAMPTPVSSSESWKLLSENNQLVLYHHPGLLSHKDVLWHSHQRPLNRQKREEFVDPLFDAQWFLVNAAHSGHDHNVTGVWEQGITGEGVVISIVDDGLEMDHPDLRDSINRAGGTDLNDHDHDPSPRYDDKNTNHHGTRCAGEIVSKPNNTICGVGIAYGAQVSGTRLLDGDVSDSMEAAAFGHAHNINDIYSCSWGPDDDGKTVDGPQPLAKRALEQGIKNGRNSLGSLFVVASGNGGRHQDNCNFDGYANSIYTLTIAGVSEGNRNPSYNEPCAATMAVAYSSAGRKRHSRSVVTTDIHGSCTFHHTGTSAAAPLAAGLMALMLEVRPCLTWRDVQYLLMMTATKLNSAVDWTTNTAGLTHSYEHGYGLLTGWRLVQSAKVWELVPPMSSWKSNTAVPKHGHLTRHLDKMIVSAIEVPELLSIATLEHVQVMVYISIKVRGLLEVKLMSPNGTESVLATPRPLDIKPHGLHNWNFSTVRCWGETPAGTWTLSVRDTGTDDAHGIFHNWRLTLHGTTQTPTDIQDRRDLIEQACADEGPSDAEILDCLPVIKSTDGNSAGGYGDGSHSAVRLVLLGFLFLFAVSLLSFLLYFALVCWTPTRRWCFGNGSSSSGAAPSTLSSIKIIRSRPVQQTQRTLRGVVYTRLGLANRDESTQALIVDCDQEFRQAKGSLSA